MMVPSSQSPSDGGMNINISAIARKIDVDHRISLRFYFRIADNILKQATIFREENNVIDLYVMLLRFSSLVSETIPYHRDYRTCSQSNKLYLKKKLMAALTELEGLNPVVKAKLQELQRKQIYQHNKPQKLSQDRMLEYSQASVKQNWNGWNATKPLSSEYDHQRPKTLTFANTGAEHLRKLTLSIPLPKEETLSKHSILGPAGLSGHWQPPSNLKVQYPSTIDLAPLQFPRESDNQQSVKGEVKMSGDDNISEQQKSNLDYVVPQPKNDSLLILKQDSHNLISFDTIQSSPQPVVIRQPSPPPLLADVEDLIPTPFPDTQIESVSDNASNGSLPCSEDPLQLHISTELMNSFMKLAKSNTDKNLETCGVLAGTLKNRKFCITALIIPKQESTSDSCQTTNEEEIFEVQDKRSLFPLGWIHTHPTQSCFMSSIDVHTHYSYQIMLPESIAIVMAPRDTSRKHGIFRLTSGGMTVIRQCPRRGFHPHDPPSDGSPIYRHCTDIYMNPSLKCEVIDLR